jgi:hypothetical protein
MVSYQLLYGGYRQKLARFAHNRELHLRYIVAGIVVPLLLIAYFAYALAHASHALFSFALTVMYITVGWHYAKQAFGILLMLSVLKQQYYSAWQRRFLLANSYVVWLFNAYIVLCGGHKNHIDYTWGFGYASPFYFEPPAAFEHALVGMVLISALASLLVIVWGRKSPSLSGLVAYFSMYYLLFLSDLHPAWILLFPLFHSLQYLMFVYAYKRGEQSIALANAPDEQAKKTQQRKLARFIMYTFLLVLPAFALPEWLRAHTADNALLVYFAASIGIFINIHHYFIDNVIWRKEHSEISHYLFHRPAQGT